MAAIPLPPRLQDRGNKSHSGFGFGMLPLLCETIVLVLKKRKIEILLFSFSFFVLPSPGEEHFVFVRSVCELSELESKNWWEQNSVFFLSLILSTGCSVKPGTHAAAQDFIDIFNGLMIAVH